MAIGGLFIAYVPVSVLMILAVIIFVGSTYWGFRFGEAMPSLREDSGKKRFIGYTVLNILTILVTLAVFVMWCFLIVKYGGISSILHNAYQIRISTMGSQTSVYPVWLGYIGSLSYGLLPLGLAYRRRIVSFISFGDIVMLDLVTFGRVGIVYAIFVIIGHVVLTERSRISLKKVFMVMGLLVVLAAPRLIRGGFDNFEGTMKTYRPYLKSSLPPALNIVVSNYIYYFSAPYALSQYMQETIGVSNMSFGLRTMAPIANVVSRLFGASRDTLVDPMASIPFPYNIYTAIHDWLVDYGFLGLLIGPFSTCMAFASLARGSGPGARSIRLFAFGYLFYTPIYFLLGLGGFFISLLMLGVLRILGASTLIIRRST